MMLDSLGRHYKEYNDFQKGATLKHFINYILIYIYIFLIISLTDTEQLFSLTTVTGLLISTIICSFSYYIMNKKFSIISSLLYAFLSFIYPELNLFTPLIMYNIAYFSPRSAAFLLLVPVSVNYAMQNTSLWLLLIFGLMLAYHLLKITSGYDNLREKNIKMRDELTELTLLLKERNKTLTEKQDYEIHNATLRERNRIAREIHDNVGHMLSRAILLTGVLKTINNDDNCSQPINNLHDALTEAMNNIRESVHNMHDESVNLEESVNSLIKNFSYCDTEVTYDMGFDVPINVKYAMISILKEGLTNIEKHSNASLVKITLREHPAIYQLIIKDNGTSDNTFNPSAYISDDLRHESCGIGLNNIASRVSTLNGTLQINCEKGFCIFVCIPKENLP